MARLFKTSTLIYLLITSSMICAGSQEESFLRANKLYKKQHYKQALELYQSMSAKGAAVWENMGSCWYTLGDYTKALIAFKRAERNTISHHCMAIQKKINAAKHALNQEIDTRWQYRWYTYIKCATSGISLLFLQLLLLFIWFGFSVCVYFCRRGKKYIFISFILGLGMIIVGTVTTIQYKEHLMQTGIVVLPKTVPIFTGPDENFHQLGALNTAQEVVIQDERSNWYKINYKQLTGWVRADAIEKI